MTTSMIGTACEPIGDILCLNKYNPILTYAQKYIIFIYIYKLYIYKLYIYKLVIINYQNFIMFKTFSVFHSLFWLTGCT